MLNKNIALIGFMGSGKTTVGKLLAEKLKATFADSDKEVEISTGLTIAEIFKKYGEPHFRQLEKQAIHKLCSENNLVISTGGGAVLDPENIKALKENCTVVFLNVTANEIASRLNNDISRPLLADNDKLKTITEKLNNRMPIYLSAMDIKIDCDGNTPEEICTKIMSRGLFEIVNYID